MKGRQLSRDCQSRNDDGRRTVGKEHEEPTSVRHKPSKKPMGENDRANPERSEMPGTHNTVQITSIPFSNASTRRAAVLKIQRHDTSRAEAVFSSLDGSFKKPEDGGRRNAASTHLHQTQSLTVNQTAAKAPTVSNITPKPAIKTVFNTSHRSMTA